MSKSRWIGFSALLVAVAALAMAFVRPAMAIPAWSRKYGTDCTACHVAGFKLNRMGQNFLRAGHHMDGGKEEQTITDYVSVAQKIRYTWAQTDTEGTALPGTKVNTFEQHALSLYMGGQLQKEFYFFAELYWHENSGKTSGTGDLDDYGRTKLADAYLQYIRRQNDESYTSVRFGQFTPYLLHLHGVGARLSQDRPYVINSGTVGDNPYKPFTRQYGAEVSQYYQGFNAAAAVMNGTGGKLFNRVDNDLKKDLYGTLDYSFGDQGSMVGVYGYLGHYPVQVDNPTKYRVKYYDDFSQLGLLGNYSVKQGAFVGALFSGRNEFSTEFAAPQDSVTEQKSLGYYAELQLYALHPRVHPYLRYDFWDPDTDKDDNEVLGPLLGISWRALDHGRLVAHYQLLKTRKPATTAGGRVPPEETKNAFVFEVNFMF